MSVPQARRWALRNAAVDGRLTSIVIEGSRIAAMGERVPDNVHCIDVAGDRVLPGLINAHDHLHRNSLGRLGWRKPYVNVCDWSDDVTAHLECDSEVRARAAAPRRDRLFAGALKNLLSGVTTVAHHDRYFDEFRDAGFPVKVVERYGWSHSLAVGDEEVQRSYRSTPVDQPWIIHAAEGVDDEACAEFARLERLGCVNRNTLIVHGIGLDAESQQRLIAASAGLIWCPTSNLYLFDKTPDVSRLIDAGRAALGSDSRLSGDRDLLTELRCADQLTGFGEEILLSLVTSAAARLLALNDRGYLRAGMAADLVVTPRDVKLQAMSRADVKLVVVDGTIKYGDASYVIGDSYGTSWSPVVIDGRSKMLEHSIVLRYLQSECREPGLDVPGATAMVA